ncbi:MAG: type II secretion system F family protein [Candidatus Pacebacteria bacterium]|jgi:type II secretory pathway component PulF|nr:type II secretion system F family protein [Candidatus Paceibacterota bacterium]
MIIGIGKEKRYFLENLSLLVASGMNVVEAIKNINDDVRSTAFKKVLKKVEQEVADGMQLWQALKNTKLFDDNAVALIRVGEESGKLSDNLNVIAIQENKNTIFRSKIRSAMLYPVFVIGMSMIVGVGIAWFILPKLSVVFAQLRVPLPAITKALVGFGTFMNEYGTRVVPLAIVAVIIIFYILFFNRSTKKIGQRILLSLPGVKRLTQELELSRFGYLLGTLLQAGLPLTQALGAITNASPFVSYKKFYAKMLALIEEGNSFEKAFHSISRSRSYIPLPIQQMIIAGEQSGGLSKSLITIGENYESKSEITSKNLSVILEPLLLVIVWVGVVFVALAVILPIYSLIGGINT